MIPRYAPEDLAALFSDERALRRDARGRAARASRPWSELGIVPRATARACRARRARRRRGVRRGVAAREAVTAPRHRGLRRRVQRADGASPSRAWVHYGLTSSDVVDTALCLQLTRGPRRARRRRARAARRARRDGRARRSTSPSRADARHVRRADDVRREVRAVRASRRIATSSALARAREAIAVGKLSGAVGTYSTIDPAVEAYVCEALGLVAVPATQVIARDRHAEVLYACAAAGDDVRGLRDRGPPPRPQRGRRGRRAVRGGPEGLVVDAPQAQPRPRRAALRARAGAARLPVAGPRGRRALARARHLARSVERVVLPDAIKLTGYMLREATWLAAGLVIDADAGAGEPRRGQPRARLLPVGAAGARRPRPRARRRLPRRPACRRRAPRATRRPFREVLDDDAEVDLDDEELDEAFDLDRLLAHRSRFLDAIERL